MTEEHLKRRIGLGLLTAYGVGVMVGAGIYVLVGAVAAQAGIWAPLSFLLAGLIAAPTALSYAEFSTRLPEAAGEAAFVGQGLSSNALAVIVGLAIVLAGTVSAGAVLRGGVGYLTSVIAIEPALMVVLFGVVLTAVAALGVLESLALAALFTLAELVGLGLVTWAGATADPVADFSSTAALHWPLVAAGGVLAFFAFIGFEDIVNMAEEVEAPERTLPRAILLSLVITSLVYGAVTWAAVRAVPVETLAASESPLTLVWQTSQGGEARFLAVIAAVAAMNGVLAQIVMAARVLFGLGRRTGALSGFHHAHPRFGTPMRATLLLGVAVIACALFLSVVELAELTTTLLLSVFVLVNAALIREKRRNPGAPFEVPAFVPWLGLVLALGALAMSFGSLF